MEVAMEFEDDLCFADLSKRISLLIMDDDEDPAAIYPSVSLQGFSGGNYQATTSPFMYGQLSRRESKGTGVFIPNSSQPRRKHRQGRQGSFNPKPQNHRHQETSRKVSQGPYNNSYSSKKG